MAKRWTGLVFTLVMIRSSAMVANRFLGVSKRSSHLMMSGNVTPDTLCAEAAKLFLADSALKFSPTSGGVNNIVVNLPNHHNSDIFYCTMSPADKHIFMAHSSDILVL